MKQPLSLVMILKNGEDTLHKTLEAIYDLPQEIIIVDDFSEDNSRVIAESFGAQVILHHEPDLGSQRAYALTLPQEKWILVLDADEVVTPEFKKEIVTIMHSKNAFDGYKIKLRNHLFGKPLKNGELHYKLQFFKNGKVNSSPSLVHEEYSVINGDVGTIRSEIYHYSYRSIRQVFRKFTDYAKRSAIKKKHEGETASFYKLFAYPVHMVYARYILDKGYRDGLQRFILDLAFGYMEFLTYFLMFFYSKETKYQEKKRIALDGGNYGGDVTSGIERIIDSFIRNAVSPENLYLFHFNEHPHFEAQVRSIQLPAFLYGEVIMPLSILFHRCTAYIGFAGHIPWVLRFFPIRKIVMMYDTGFIYNPKKYANPQRLYNQTKQALISADVIVVLSKTTKEQFERAFPEESKDKIVHIPAGIDHLCGFVPKRVEGIDKGTQYLLYVGVVKPIKDISHMISLFITYKQRNPKSQLQLLIVGNKEEHYFAQLAESVLRHQMANSIQFLDHVTDQELAHLYIHAQGFLNVSLEEGFCFPVCEAIAFDVPVIVSDIQRFQEMKELFPNIMICKTDDEIFDAIELVTKKRRVPQTDCVPITFSWNNFTELVIGLS